MIKKHKKREGTTIPNIDLQYQWMSEYKIDSIALGRMCHEYPALKKSWKQFKTIYQICEAEYEVNTKVS